MNHNPSEEQKAIIENLKNQYNITVEAVAGSGKTTTCLLIAKSFKEKEVLILTYNKRLADETKEKINLWNLKNVKVRTFHSFMGYWFNTLCDDDLKLAKIKSDSKPIRTDGEKSDIIILDEVQDMTPLIYEPLMKILKTKFSHSLICVLGDSKQSIYGFKNSNPNFLINAEYAFKEINDYEWKEMSLSESFRITKECANFINEVYYNEKIINSNKKIDGSFNYLVTNAFDTNSLYYYLKPIFDKYNDEDIFILSNSVKSSRNPLGNFATFLSNKGHLIYKPFSDEENIVDNELMNKIVFSSIHQAKGRERKVAIIFDFDNSYFSHYDKYSDHKKPTNLHYVALTRSSEKTIVINHFSNQAFKFLNFNNLKEYIQYNISEQDKETWNKNNNLEFEPFFKNDVTEKSVSSLLSFLPIEHFNKELEKFDIKKIKYNTRYSLEHIPNSKKFVQNNKEYYENLTVFNGVYFPLYYVYKVKKLDNIIDNIKSIVNSVHSELPEFNFLKEKKEWIMQVIEEYEKKKINILKLVLLMFAIDNQDFSRLNQIQEIDWISKKDNQTAMKIFKGLLSNKCEFEYNISLKHKDGITYSGRIDCVDYQNKTIWEFKFIEEILPIHRLQLILYKTIIYLDEQLREKFKDFKYCLFNLKKSEIEYINYIEPKLVSLFNKIIKIQKNKNSLNNKQEDFEIYINEVNSRLQTKVFHKLVNKKTRFDINLSFSKQFKNHKELMKEIIKTSEDKYVIIDFETVNNMYGVIQFAMIVVENGKIVKSFNEWLKPSPWWFDEFIINSVRDEENQLSIEEIQEWSLQFKDKLTLKQYFKNIKDYFNGDYVVYAHNAAFDVSSVIKNQLRINKDFIFVCTVQLFKKLLPNLENHKLNTIANHFDIKFNHHDAYADVMVIYDILQANSASMKEWTMLAIERGMKLRVYLKETVFLNVNGHLKYFQDKCIKNKKIKKE